MSKYVPIRLSPHARIGNFTDEIPLADQGFSAFNRTGNHTRGHGAGQTFDEWYLLFKGLKKASCIRPIAKNLVYGFCYNLFNLVTLRNTGRQLPHSDGKSCEIKSNTSGNPGGSVSSSRDFYLYYVIR